MQIPFRQSAQLSAASVACFVDIDSSGPVELFPTIESTSVAGFLDVASTGPVEVFPDVVSPSFACFA